MSHLLISSDEGLRTVASSLITKLCQEAGTTIIHVFYLGEFRVFVNGREISDQDWQTQKVENLFKFLAANRRQYLKEEVIEQFWPESDPDLGDSNLRMSLSRIRKTIKLDKQQSVILQRSQVYLNPKIEVYTDFELFSSEAEKAMQYVEDGSPYAVNALEQAVYLYRGIFLPENIYNDWTNIFRTHLQSLFH